nr:OmpA family protein [uncultured Cupriavidus sp.]
MWCLKKRNFPLRRGQVLMLVAAFCVAGLERVAWAQPVIDEKEVDEQSVINALNPESAEESATTRGIMYKGSGATGDAVFPVTKPTLALLITFATNSTVLTPRARAALDKVGRALQSAELSGYKFRVEGHADPRGSADANMELSTARAAAVRNYLSREDGVAPERLSSVGKGSSEPLNTLDPGAPENRRVTIIRLSK